MHVTPPFINLHWLPIAAYIKFKALMFAYKTTTGSAPLYLNSLLQTYVPSRSLHSAIERRFIVPSQWGSISLSQAFKLNGPLLVEWPAQLKLSSWVLSHLQESAKNISPSLFDPLTLALSIIILFFKKTSTSFYNLLYSICFLFIYYTINKSKKRPLTLVCSYSFSILSVLFYLLYKKKKPCYVYCVKLTEDLL